MNTIFALGLLPPAVPLAAVPWRPFLDPMPLAWFDAWYLWMLPLAALVSLSYKAVRAQEIKPRPFLRGVAIMTIQIILGMVALAAASYLLVEVFVPLLSA